MSNPMADAMLYCIIERVQALRKPRTALADPPAEPPAGGAERGEAK